MEPGHLVPASPDLGFIESPTGLRPIASKRFCASPVVEVASAVWHNSHLGWLRNVFHAREAAILVASRELAGSLVLRQVEFVFDFFLTLDQFGEAVAILEWRFHLRLGLGQPFARVGKG